jgi:uncharacterized membrane protein
MLCVDRGQLLWGNVMTQAAKSNLLAIGGAIIGGLAGYFIFLWLASQGFYGLIIPGGLLGIAAGFAKSRSLATAGRVSRCRNGAQKPIAVPAARLDKSADPEINEALVRHLKSFQNRQPHRAAPGE